jgi:hypothetical protein
LPMKTDTLQKIAALRAEADALESKVAAAQAKELAALPAKYGFSSAADFVAAVTAATGARRGRKPGKAAKPVAAGKKRRKRAVITDAMKAEVKKLVEADKTGAEIAKAVGISLPSVQNIKKELGLVKAKTSKKK